MVEEECDDCKGSGKEFPDCKVCGGDGWVDDPTDGGTMVCPECKDSECPVCEGDGYIEVDE